LRPEAEATQIDNVIGKKREAEMLIYQAGRVII